jgi:hypothetical protein
MRVASKVFRLVVSEDGRGGVARGQRQRGDAEMVVVGEQEVFQTPTAAVL